MPPRHGKTETLTVRYPVFRLEQDLKTRAVIACYNQTLASKFGRKARRIAEQRFAPDPEQENQLAKINHAPIPGLLEIFDFWWKGKK